MLAVSAPLLNSAMRSLVWVLWTRTRVPWMDNRNIIASWIPLFLPPYPGSHWEPGYEANPLPYLSSLLIPPHFSLSLSHLRRACSNPGALLIDGYAAHLVLVDMTDHFCGSHLGSLCSQQVLEEWGAWLATQTASGRQLMLANIHHDLNGSLLFPWKCHQLAVYTRTYLTQTWENSRDMSLSVCHMSHTTVTWWLYMCIPTSWVGVSLYCAQKFGVGGKAKHMNFCHQYHYQSGGYMYTYGVYGWKRWERGVTAPSWC